MRLKRLATPVLIILALLVIGAILVNGWVKSQPTDTLESVRTDSDLPVLEEDAARSHPSLTLSQSTDRLFAGECGEPQTVSIVAAVHGSAEDLGG